MKKSLSLSLLAVFAFALTTATAQTTTNFQANGVTASMTACINNCNGLVGLTLDSSHTTGQTTWLVFFDVFGQDSQGNLTIIEAVGPVPASMVSGNGITSLTLNLDTNAAGLNVQFCVADQSLNFTCSPFAGGTMDISWTPTKSFSGSGTTEDSGTSGTMTIKSHTSGDFSSAVTQSTVFGQQYADTGQSQIGNVHAGQITITRQ